MIQIEIDNGSGFCFGVTTAIKKAEEELAKGEKLYCLGDIVHNGMECDRLREMGLVTINHDEMAQLHDAKVLLRAHGEPPETYALARRNNIEIIDATCPVVLKLQKRIKEQYDSNAVAGDFFDERSGKAERQSPAQIVIFGKKGHAEVLGLVGQTHSNAIVIESSDEVTKLDFSRDIYLYSQTTKSLDEFNRIIDTFRPIFLLRPRLRASIPFAARLPTACQTSRSLPPSTILSSLSVGARALTARFFITSASVLTPTAI